MRRTVLYTAGLFIAAGASLALAGPASAAPASDAQYCSVCSQTPSKSYSANQYLLQGSLTNQTVLNNIGNPQVSVFGKGDLINKGGSASAKSTTTQIGGNFFGW